ncbi:E3 ubiquitin-protein ligase BOI [Cocos nucifera]|nr:E3 ubiquitin-protein ligase BOI [Cocos nucifera]
MDEEFLLENSSQSFNQQQRPQQILAPFPPSMITPESNSLLDHSPLMSPLPSLMEKQNETVDQYLCLQNEQLIFSLDMQTKQHMSSLLTKLESKASMLLRWKEEELANASMRTQALQDCVSRAEEEKEMWKNIALEKEAMALALKATLERAQEPCFVSKVALGIEDRHSCFSFPWGRKEDNEQIGETNRVLSPCKLCGNQDSCMLFLPCQHLCACKECEASLSECPLCKSLKIDSLEVLLV